MPASGPYGGVLLPLLKVVPTAPVAWNTEYGRGVCRPLLAALRPLSCPPVLIFYADLAMASRTKPGGPWASAYAAGFGVATDSWHDLALAAYDHLTDFPGHAAELVASDAMVLSTMVVAVSGAAITAHDRLLAPPTNRCLLGTIREDGAES